jgi:holin-like protein
MAQATERTLALRGFAWLLALQTAGELLARGLGLPFPGPVVGMLLLLSVLPARWVREPVAACADALLAHLSPLFVPVGVGVMTHLSLLGDYGGRMMLVVVLSTWAGLAVTALVLRLLARNDDAEIR